MGTELAQDLAGLDICVETPIDECGFCPTCHALVPLVRVKLVWLGVVRYATHVASHGVPLDCATWNGLPILTMGDGWISWTIRDERIGRPFLDGSGNLWSRESAYKG